MSKSRGSVVRPLDLADKYGVEAFRYFVLREMTFGLDAGFSEEALVARLNADLANDLGNLYSRVLKLIQRYYDGRISESPGERGLVDAVRAAVTDVTTATERFAFSEALAAIWNLVSATNKYLVTNEPWKQDPGDARTKVVLFSAAETLRAIAILLWPFLPQTAERMLQGLGAPEPLTSIHFDELLSSSWHLGSRQGRVQEVEPLFPRIQVTAAKPLPRKSPPLVPSPSEGGGLGRGCAEQITIEEFRRIDLRVAEVIEAVAIPGSKKLVKLRVRLQDEERIVVAGLKEHYPPESWAGKRIILVANLRPTKLMGIASQGMVLAAEDESGRIVLLTPEQPTSSGAKVR